jgi:MFS transporter, UMF1 family
MTLAPGDDRAGRRERLSWAMYDFANSGYTTVVLTTVFNAYFVAVIASGGGFAPGTGTFLWTLAIGIANVIVIVSAPVIGAIADGRAAKKRFLLVTSVGCVVTTALLASAGPGDVALAMVLVAISLVCFDTGENLIAAFLPELVPDDEMGRMSGYGWGLGYLGGLITLALCLGYIGWAQGRGQTEADFVPATLLITAAVFALAAVPTFLFLRERATPHPPPAGISYLRAGLGRVFGTIAHAHAHRDLFRFLVALVVFQSGVNTVVVLTAVYARAEFGLDSRDLVLLVMVVNLAAAAGSLAVGFAQDRFGSVRSLAVTLIVWIVGLVLVLRAQDMVHVWIAAHVMGFAMGGSQSCGRALVGLFTPAARTAEFFGLWGLANRVATIIGPVTYGLVNLGTGGNQHAAMFSTIAFFAAGLLLLLRVDETRGVAAARASATSVSA